MDGVAPPGVQRDPGNRAEILEVARAWIRVGLGVVPITPQYLSGKLSYSVSVPRWGMTGPFLDESSVMNHWTKCEPTAQVGVGIGRAPNDDGDCDPLTVWVIDDHRLDRGGSTDGNLVVPPNDVYHERRPAPGGGLHVIFATRAEELRGWAWLNFGDLYLKGQGPPRWGDVLHGCWVAPSIDPVKGRYVALTEPRLAVYESLDDALQRIAPWLVGRSNLVEHRIVP